MNDLVAPSPTDCGEPCHGDFKSTSVPSVETVDGKHFSEDLESRFIKAKQAGTK